MSLKFLRPTLFLHPKSCFFNTGAYGLPLEILVQVPRLNLFILEDVVGAAAFFSLWPDTLRTVFVGFSNQERQKSTMLSAFEMLL